MIPRDDLEELRDNMIRLGPEAVAAVLTVKMFDLVGGHLSYIDASAFTFAFNRELARYASCDEAMEKAEIEIARRRGGVRAH